MQILHDGLDLGRNQRRSYRLQRVHPRRILRGDRGDGARTEHAERVERFQVGLQAGTAAGITPGDR